MEKLFEIYKTRQAVAKVLGVTPSMVSMIVHGERSLTAARAVRAVKQSNGKLTLNDLLM